MFRQELQRGIVEGEYKYYKELNGPGYVKKQKTMNYYNAYIYRGSLGEGYAVDIPSNIPNKYYTEYYIRTYKICTSRREYLRNLNNKKRRKKQNERKKTK